MSDVAVDPSSSSFCCLLDIEDLQEDLRGDHEKVGSEIFGCEIFGRGILGRCKIFEFEILGLLD